ncbi:hypothetical protein P43SY_008824 [Pythium insidiosum]|uniref:Calponin-homology (CH) domain-containing protein n=1 Tax=Pythium insidiosum TaxID=114742 RepID=A0AAD5Q6A5_PYTIN|nr:hypothetical protein P43SY_008824 [Pythium insidiosum]
MDSIRPLSTPSASLKRRKDSTLLPPADPHVVGSPVNLRRSSNQSPLFVPSTEMPTARRRASQAPGAISPLKKPRPATAIVLSSSSTINSLLATHDASLPLPSSASAPVSSADRLAPGRRQTQRCAGCGGFAELCMACLAQLKQQDVAVYKRQIIRSVDVLFERATARAFTRMSSVVLQWIFGVWRRETRHARRRRLLAVAHAKRQRLRRQWAAWRVHVLERRIIGAMLFAEQQQRVTQDKTREIAQLHGDVFELHSTASVHEQVHSATRASLSEQLEGLQRSLHQRNQELLALRRELLDARERIATLEQQAIDPRDLERLKTENVDLKKISFQLIASLFTSLETQMDVLATSEGRQNLNHVFSKDVLQLLDKPEHAGFYNPLVDLETVAPTAQQLPSVLAAYDAPIDRADRILLQWVNALLQRPTHDWLQAPRITNFNTSLSDGRALVVLTKVLHAAMVKFRPKRPPGVAPSRLESASVLRDNGEDLTEIAMERYMEHVKREDAADKRLELMITTIGQALWLPVGLLSAKDVLAGDNEFNFATLTYLFATSAPCLDDAHYALCNDLKVQLSSSRSKWRELRESATMGGASGAGSGDEVSLSAKMKLALAQTLDLKKKIETEDAKAREGHLLWWKSVRIVLRKCFLSYARVARGKAGVLSKSEAAQDENEAFAKIPRARLTDLELPFEDFAWETKLLQSYLVTIYCDLARIYRGYAARRDGGTFLTVGDLLELLGECRVLDATTLATQDVYNVIRKIDPKITGTVSNHRVLTPLEFLEALVRVARRKFSAETHRITLSEAFCLLVDNSILPFAFRSDADLFRKQLEDPKIRRLLIKFSDELRELFARYAIEGHRRHAAGSASGTGQGHSGGAGSRRARISAFAFSQCLLDRNVQDVSLNSEKVLSIVQRVARTHKKEREAMATSSSSSSSASSSSAVNASFSALPIAAAMALPGDDDEMTFEEFEEALVAIACFKFPDPYISLESRLEKFLVFYIRGNGILVGGGALAGSSGAQLAERSAEPTDKPPHGSTNGSRASIMR